MQTYRFDKKTKEFLYAETAYLDPLETEQQGKDVYLLPANSTFDTPPTAKSGYAVMWNGVTWELVEDHRRKLDKSGMPIENTGTPFWIPGDTWQTPARYMVGLGKLPDNAILKRPEKPVEVLIEENLTRAKAERANAVAAITVEVDGMVFDGNEKAQERMARAVLMSNSLEETIEWVLHNNTVAIVTAEQLRRACRLAGQAQTVLWTIPYTNLATD
jgi:hypothetical protein